MKPTISVSVHWTVVLLLSLLVAVGCSSSDPASSNSPTDDLSSGAGDSPEVEDNQHSDTVTDTTQVRFDITVPAYVSDGLQVHLDWGQNSIAASWLIDESWSATDEYPINTERPLVVTFSDANGSVTLGVVETNFKTGSSQTQTVLITADQFDTRQWDQDGDGTSNLEELSSGTNPLIDESNAELNANLELVSDKTFRVSWQSIAGARFYRLLENPDGVSGYSPISGDLDQAILSFDHRVALYSRVNARYMVQACNSLGCVDSNEIMVTGSLVQAIGYLKASNTDPGDSFGTALSMSADGNTLIVGATGEGSAATGIDGGQTDNSANEAIFGYAAGAGAVYVFERVDGQWVQTSYLKASNTDRSDQFGYAVSLSADGNTLVATAPYESSSAVGVNGDQADNSDERSGAAYVFAKVNGSWQQQAYLKSDQTDSDFFGNAVSLNASGNRLAIAADLENRGAVYLFERDAGVWRQQVRLYKTDTDISNFGSALSFSADGNLLAVGARRRPGRVYLYQYSDGRWNEQTVLRRENAILDDDFGTSVFMSADGNTLAVGAIAEQSSSTGINSDESEDNALGAGAVYVFTNSSGDWQQQAYIKASNTIALSYFGSAVALSEDGNILAVGSVGDGSTATGINGDQFEGRPDSKGDDVGAVFVYTRQSGVWQQQAYVKASNSERSDYFGQAITLSADGSSLAVGAALESSAATGINGYQADNSARFAGAVYLY